MEMVFFFNDTATTEIYTLSLHDALPILFRVLTDLSGTRLEDHEGTWNLGIGMFAVVHADFAGEVRSEEHTSELQSRQYLVCRLLLEKKKRDPASLLQVALLKMQPPQTR